MNTITKIMIMTRTCIDVNITILYSFNPTIFFRFDSMRSPSDSFHYADK